jgi:hypothetical protein
VQLLTPPPNYFGYIGFYKTSVPLRHLALIYFVIIGVRFRLLKMIYSLKTPNTSRSIHFVCHHLLQVTLQLCPIALIFWFYSSVVGCTTFSLRFLIREELCPCFRRTSSPRKIYKGFAISGLFANSFRHLFWIWSSEVFEAKSLCTVLLHHQESSRSHSRLLGFFYWLHKYWGGWPGPVSSCPTKILSWNCRGLAQPSTIRSLRAMIRKNNLDIIFLSASTIASSLMLKLGFNMLVQAPPSSSRGGLLIAWKNDVTLYDFYESQDIWFVLGVPWTPLLLNGWFLLLMDPLIRKQILISGPL